jgi:DNA polymerase III delta prime subunit
MEEDSVGISWLCTGNKIDDIILPLQSRVNLVDCSYSTRAKREAHYAGIARRLRHILSAEGVTGFSDEALRRIVELHYPDIRQTINALQCKCAS